MQIPHLTRTAVLSDDGVYRYDLTRVWHDWVEKPRLLTFVMLNPSTADAEVDDPTMRRCIGFAVREGFDGLRVVNLYALRSPAPALLWSAPDPVGPDNDQHIADALAAAAAIGAPVVAGWGAHARQDRVDEVLAMPHADRFAALGVTLAGAPRHPLYMRNDAPLWRWPLGDDPRLWAPHERSDR